jgi:hypothetical protein
MTALLDSNIRVKNENAGAEGKQSEATANEAAADTVSPEKR